MFCTLFSSRARRFRLALKARSISAGWRWCYISLVLLCHQREPFTKIWAIVQSQHSLWKAGLVETHICPHCNTGSTEDLQHLWWECPAWDSIRARFHSCFMLLWLYGDAFGNTFGCMYIQPHSQDFDFFGFPHLQVRLPTIYLYVWLYLHKYIYIHIYIYIFVYTYIWKAPPPWRRPLAPSLGLVWA